MDSQRLNELIADLENLNNEQIQRANALHVAFVILSRGDQYREVEVFDLISCASFIATGQDPYLNTSPPESPDAMTWKPGTVEGADHG